MGNGTRISSKMHRQSIDQLSHCALHNVPSLHSSQPTIVYHITSQVSFVSAGYTRKTPRVSLCNSVCFRPLLG